MKLILAILFSLFASVALAQPNTTQPNLVTMGLTTCSNNFPIVGTGSALVPKCGPVATFTAVGTSGGIPYFSSTTQLSSSALLTANGVVIGGGAGTTPSTISVGTNGQLLLGVTGSPPAFGTMSGDVAITNAGVATIQPAAVTYAKIQNMTNSRLLGNNSGGAAAPSEISLAAGGSLAFSSSTLLRAALTGDVTASADSNTTVLTNIPTGVTAAGSILFTNIAAPSTPASGKCSLYVDSTSKNIACKNDAGTVNHGVQSQSSVSNQWIKTITDSGQTTTTQPAFSDISGSVTCAQLPALTGDITTSAGSCATTNSVKTKWISYSLTGGTLSILGSSGINTGSTARNGTGDTTIVFTSAFTGTNTYTANCYMGTIGANIGVMLRSNGTAASASQFRALGYTSNGFVATDFGDNQCVFIGN